jgi:hypothetical protein
VKIGKYDIPQFRLHPSLVGATKILYEQYKSEEAPDTLTVSKLLGHKSAKSGGFLTKLADMRSYGLITSRGITVTDLGKKLTYGETEDEKNEAYKNALLNIPLWKEFYGKFGKTLPTSNFWAQLGKITGLEAPDAQKVEEIVRKAYLDDIRYVIEEKKPEKGDSGMGDEDKFDTSKATPSVERQANIVQNLIKEGAYDIAKEFIDFIKKKEGNDAS